MLNSDDPPPQPPTELPVDQKLGLCFLANVKVREKSRLFFWSSCLCFSNWTVFNETLKPPSVLQRLLGSLSYLNVSRIVIQKKKKKHAE